MSQWKLSRNLFYFLCLLYINFSVHAVSTQEYFSNHTFLKHQKFRIASLNQTKNNRLRAPIPIPVTVSVAHAHWITTISICNTTNTPIPLKDLEFSFNYSVQMPVNIWGTPWVAWRVESQTGSQVLLQGGTPYSPNLPPDPNCRTPLTVQFNATPETALPTGPFVFKAETGVTPTTGDLNVTLNAAPAAGLSNPTLTVTSGSFTRSQQVPWGTSWKLTGLSPASYTVTGSTVTNGATNYTADPVAATVTAGATAQATLTYKPGTTPTGNVTVTLINPPSAQVPVTFTGANSTVNQTVSNNSVVTLAADTYTVTSNVPGYNATATPNPLTVPTQTALSLSYTSTTPTTGARTINLVNQCPFPVWFGFISGYTGTCAAESDCPPGSTCVDRGAGGKACFWKTPVPANNDFRLAPNGGTNSVKLPIYPNLDFIYSGAAAGRTNCTAAGCETADCGGGTGACPSGRGFSQPTTQAEFTLGKTSSDFYNLELINGVNLPISMAPVLTGPKTGGPYDCGGPGATTAVPPLGACPWEFTPPAVEYNWVRRGGAACTANSDCAAPAKCGLSFNPGSTPLLKKTCGTLLGYWTANQVCGIQPTYGAPFNCQQSLPAPNAGLKLNNLYGCTAVGSCYQPGAPDSCCGCANWDKLGVDVPPGPATAQCVNTNPNWTQLVQPTLLWLKKACPSIYTYPFDDMSSTFICRIMKDGVNMVDYTITFCPGGKTGGIVA